MGSSTAATRASLGTTHRACRRPFVRGKWKHVAWHAFERRVVLRAYQAAAVDEERRRRGDAEARRFGQVALDDGAVGVVIEHALERG